VWPWLATVNVTDQYGLGSLRDTWSHTAKGDLHTAKSFLVVAIDVQMVWVI